MRAGVGCCLAIALLLGAAGSARAEVAVLTMTPGPRLFERFGHTALLAGGRVYNFGTFDGDDPHLLRKFLTRDLPYWLSVGSPASIFEHYGNRRITYQVLAITPTEERQLLARLEDNARPEHRGYRYDFFLDNCATRVRDAIDLLTGGALARAGSAPGRSTYRGLVEEVLAGPPLLGAGVSLLLNASTDRPTTRWEEAFLPIELASLLSSAVREGGRPLVQSTRTWTGPDYDGPGTGQPRLGAGRWVDRGALLLLWGPLPVVAAGEAVRRRRRWRRPWLGGALALGGLAAGLLGGVLVVAALTPYPCARGNANLVVLHPLLLALVPAGVALARGAAPSALGLRAGRLVVLGSLAVGLSDLLVHAAGVATQRHLPLVLAVLAWEALAWLLLLRPAPAGSPGWNLVAGR